MRIAIALLAMTAVAHADRRPVMTLGVTVDVDPGIPVQVGGRVTLGFEDEPLIAAAGEHLTDVRLVPEIFGGFEIDHGHPIAEGGAGIRGELQLARACADSSCGYSLALYLAPRLTIVGGGAGVAGELAAGVYTQIAGGRLGFETSAPLVGGDALDVARFQVYVGARY